MEAIFLLIVVFLVCLFLTIFALLIYSGLFAHVEIGAGKPPFDTLLIAYKFARGPYKNAGGLFTEVYNLVPSLKSVALYYDDPSEVAASELRYVVGAVLSESEADEGDAEYRALLTKHGFRITKLPAVSHALHTAFPFRNTLSIYLSLSRVYPKLSAYIKERNLCAHPMIEVYDGDFIHFVAPLAKQDEFYVPEAQDAEDDVSTSREAAAGQDELQPARRDPTTDAQAQQPPGSGAPQKEGSSNGSGEESTGSSFEELNVDNDK